MTNTIAPNCMQSSKGDIVFVLPTLRSGGAERVVSILLQHIDQNKFNSVYLVVLDMTDAVYIEFPTFVRLINLKCTRVRYAFFKLTSILWRIQPKIIFSTLNNLNLYLAAIRPLLPRAIYIGRESSIVSYANKYFGYSILRDFLCRLLYPRLDKIICQSHFMADDLCDYFGISRDKVSIIYNPIDYEFLNKYINMPHERPCFDGEFDLALVAVGRLSKEKGFDLLLESLSLIDDFLIHLIVVGDGVEAKNLLEMVQRMPLSKHRIEFSGFRLDPYRYIKDADYFVLSSRFEGLPNAVLESLACGTPVIAVPSPGGLKEVVIDGYNGFVAENISSHALAVAIRRGFVSLNSSTALPRSDLLPDVCNLDLVIRQYQDIFDSFG